LSADITDVSGVASASVQWTITAGAAGSATMLPVSGNSWSASTGTLKIKNTNSLSWTVVATDTLGNVTSAASGVPVNTTGNNCK
jgi:hypothetical protein